MADDKGPAPDDLACIELVDSVTESLDGELDEAQRRHIDEHLETCEGCRAALDQFQTVIDLAGRLTADDVARIDARVRDRLMATLRVMRRR